MSNHEHSELIKDARSLASMDWREGPPTIEAAHQKAIALALVAIAETLKKGIVTRPDVV